MSERGIFRWKGYRVIFSKHYVSPGLRPNGQFTAYLLRTKDAVTFTGTFDECFDKAFEHLRNLPALKGMH